MSSFWTISKVFTSLSGFQILCWLLLLHNVKPKTFLVEVAESKQHKESSVKGKAGNHEGGKIFRTSGTSRQEGSGELSAEVSSGAESNEKSDIDPKITGFISNNIQVDDNHGASSSSVSVSSSSSSAQSGGSNGKGATGQIYSSYTVTNGGNTVFSQTSSGTNNCFNDRCESNVGSKKVKREVIIEGIDCCNQNGPIIFP